MFSYSDPGQMQQEVTLAEQYAKKHHDPLRRMVEREMKYEKEIYGH